MRLIFIILAALVATILPPALTAQQSNIIVSGVVLDSVSKKPVFSAAVFVDGTPHGALTDESGRFNLVANKKPTAISITAMGYKTEVLKIQGNDIQNLEFQLHPLNVALKTITVNRGKEKYSKKNNPAVELIQRLMSEKSYSDPKTKDFYSHKKYTKINCGIMATQPIEGAKENSIHKKLGVLFNNVDTISLTGKRVIPVLIKEIVASDYFRKDPRTQKEIVEGKRHSGIDAMFDADSFQKFLEDVFREIDIFGNDVTFLQNRFVSPLSVIGTNFYKYYLNDTILIDGEPCVDLSFAPFNPESFGFTGRLYISLAKPTLFVKKVKLNVSKNINANYVKRVFIEQDYDRSPDDLRIKKRDDMIMEFEIVKGTNEFYSHRTTSYFNHSFTSPDDLSVFSGLAQTEVSPTAEHMPDEFWKENRTIPLKTSENNVDNLLSNLRKVPLWYWSEKVIVALVAGYVSTDTERSKFDFGPMNTTISGNTIEGARFRIGGMTTANLNPHWLSRGYVAYGTKDKKLKYSAQLEYSFPAKKYHNLEFPIHSLRLKHEYDLDHLGQHYLYTNSDNVFLALKRQPDDKATYRRLSTLDYTLETHSGFSVVASLSNCIQEASPYLNFVDGNGSSFKRYGQTSIGIALRYAPGEKFYQTKTYRIPINLDAPVISLQHTFSPKGFLGNKFAINKTELGLQKRFWFSAFGYTDIILKAGKVWSASAYPDLLIPNANLSYTVQYESYSLMNAIEFINDQYVSWDLTYWANGWMFNRVPLLKKLKLREVFSFRGLYGSLTDKNNPDKNTALFAFPDTGESHLMGKKPYMEVGVGLDNIFTFLRLDYVWRLSRNNHTQIDRHGLRIQLHFTF